MNPVNSELTKTFLLQITKNTHHFYWAGKGSISLWFSLLIILQNMLTSNSNIFSWKTLSQYFQTFCHCLLLVLSSSSLALLFHRALGTTPGNKYWKLNGNFQMCNLNGSCGKFKGTSRLLFDLEYLQRKITKSILTCIYKPLNSFVADDFF